MQSFEEIRCDSRIEECVLLMRSAFGTVAREFGLAEVNAPTNPAFVTAETLRRYLQRPARLSGLLVDDRLVGCVAVERARDHEGTYYLERLAVLPECRHRGYGALLLSRAVEEIRKAGGREVSVGLMNDNAVLKSWYVRHGFAETGRRRFDHLPFEVCFMSRSIAELYHESRGDGPPVLLLHAGVADSRMWDDQMEAFSAAHRVIRCDLRGFGRSPLPRRPYAHHEDVAALLGQLGLGQVCLVGASFGGAVAIDVALAHPRLVAALVLVSPALGGYEPTGDAMRRFLTDEEEALERGDLDAATEVNLRMWVDGPGRNPARVPAALRERVREMQRQHFAAPRPAEARELELEPPAVGRLGEIRMPTLVVTGELDLPDFHHIAAILEGGIPRARRIVVPEVAHLPSMEKPRWFSEAVLRFLDQTG